MYEWAEFRHFRYLIAILDKRGFRAAAEELHTSQPNLTVQARQFQDNAGVRLFRRSRAGRIHPTESGVAFVGLARHLLAVRDEVMEAIVAIEQGDTTSLCCAASSLVDQELFKDLCSMQRSLAPSVTVRPTHGDIQHLVEELEAGSVDVALVTLPLVHADLQVEEIHRDRLVVCLRKDDRLAAKPALSVADVQDRLRVFYHPQKHPEAHNRLLELLDAAGIRIREFSRASHPSEMRALVRDGFGAALVREGIALEDELITRPISGVNWTVDTALVYHKVRHSKLLPILVRQFKMKFGQDSHDARSDLSTIVLPHIPRKPIETVPFISEEPVQLRLLG